MLLDDNLQTPVLAHGDAHMWNIAFEGSPDQPPSNVKIFDLQECRALTSGVDDIVQYLHQVLVLGHEKDFRTLFYR